MEHEIKQVKLDLRLLKAGPEDGLGEGEFIVYPSTFTRTPDAYGDVVAPGAFLEDIERRRKTGTVLPGLFGHRMDDPDFYVAYAIEEGEDEHGWWVKGAFDQDPKSQKVYRLVKGRRISELSFAYDVKESGRVEIEPEAAGAKAGTEKIVANELRKLETFEFSFVPIGANRDTGVLAIKSLEARAAALLDGVKAGRVLSAKNEGALRSARDTAADVVKAIDAVLGALEDDGKASAPAPVKADEPSGVKADEPAGTASATARLHLALATADAEFLTS